MIDFDQEYIMRNWDRKYNGCPLVTVRCMTYNHEPYIEKALDSFLLQETNFPFDIYVHDDASTDNTAEIIKKYEKKFPDIIHPVYESENQYSKHDGSLSRVMNSYCFAKYTAVCEGDDFWTDSHKLQKQFDCLEKSSCKMCVHNTIAHDLQGNKHDYTFSKWKDSKVLNDEDVFFGWNVHTSSYFYETKIQLRFPKFPDQNTFIFGDYVMLVWFHYFGGIYYIPDIMSTYNLNCPVGVSLKLKNNNDSVKVDAYRARQSFLRQFNEYTNGKYQGAVEKRICELEYDAQLQSGNYKVIFNKQYKDYYKKDKLKTKIIVLSRAIFPFLKNVHKQ